MRRQAACSCPEKNVEVHFGCETKAIVFCNVFDVASEMIFSVYFGAATGSLPAATGSLPAVCRAPACRRCGPGGPGGTAVKTGPFMVVDLEDKELQPTAFRGTLD